MSVRRSRALFIAIGLSVSLIFGAAQARAEERTFWTGIKQGIVLGLHYELSDLFDVGSGSNSRNSVRLHCIDVGRNVIRRKIATEEFVLQKGVKLHPSRSSTLQRGVSLSRSFESLINGGVEIGTNGGINGGVNAGVQGGVTAGIIAALKAEIGARVTDMLSNEIQESSSMGVVVELNGDVLESARIEWYAHVHSGRATLEANGYTREIPFEFIVGYEPKIDVTPRRRRSVTSDMRVEGSLPVQRIADSSVPRFGHVTAVSKEWPGLFESRFETAVNASKGDRQPVYRGRLDPKCIGWCKVVAVRDCRIVAECEGFTPLVGDTVGLVR